MSYKQIERSREARLWLGQVIIPLLTGSALMLANPELSQKIADRANRVKTSIKNKFKKKEG